MSQAARRRMELKRQRKRELRLEQARNQCRSILTACETTIARTKDITVQQLADSGLRKARKELQKASARIEKDPKRARKSLEATQKRLQGLIVKAQAEAHQWSRAQAASQARISEVQARAEAERAVSNEAGVKVLGQVEVKLGEANALDRQGRHAQAARKVAEAKSLVDQASEATFDETVRREVVRGLFATLQEMGFVVDGPTCARDGDGPGIVSLTGHLPSGRKVRFEVQLDGNVGYDLDGYEGRTCARQIERIEETLRNRFSVKMGPAQVIWKDPDRISRGARGLPTGGVYAKNG